MDSQGIIDTFNTKLSEAETAFAEVLRTFRTGRANASVLDGVVVEAYGTSMPLKQVGSINTVGADLIQITPFDPANLAAITTAISSNSSLGLNPSDDGHVVRIHVPPLSEERRQEIAKQINEKAEECFVKMRGFRHDAISSVEQLKKDHKIGEDEAKRLNKTIEDKMALVRKSVEDQVKGKQTEILTI